MAGETMSGADSRVGRALGRLAAAGALLALLALGVSAISPGAAHADHAKFCGPMDVVFAIDTTGSMGGAIGNVQTEAASLIGPGSVVDHASGGDFKLGLVTFKDNVTVNVDLAALNDAAVTAAILGLSASGGAGEPEASDEALNTIINGLDVPPRTPAQQTGNFDGTFRPSAVKITILITDARPGGFDDTFTAGVDDVNAHQRALDAVGKKIRISAVFVPTFGDIGQVVIMQDYADTSDGLFVQTASTGVSTASAIQAIIDKCGGAPPPGIGGISEFPARPAGAAEGAVAADDAGWSTGVYAVIAAGIALGVGVLGAGGLYARRRLTR